MFPSSCRRRPAPNRRVRWLFSAGVAAGVTLLAVRPFGDGAHFQLTGSAIKLAMPIPKPLSYGSSLHTSATRVV